MLVEGGRGAVSASPICTEGARLRVLLGTSSRVCIVGSRARGLAQGCPLTATP